MRQCLKMAKKLIMDNTFVQIGTFNFITDPEVPLFENELLEAGINYQIRNKGILSQDPLLSIPIGGVQFFVQEADAEAATALYQTFLETHGINTGDTKMGKGCIFALVATILLIVIGLLYIALQ